jgi:hypothetical protein
MALRNFKSFIRDRQRPVSTRAVASNLKEETDDAEITDAASVIIGSELLAIERKSLSDSFVNDIKKITDDGRSIIAIAVALE